MYKCNGFLFKDINTATSYANYYFQLLGIVLGIEYVEGVK